MSCSWNVGCNKEYCCQALGPWIHRRYSRMSHEWIHITQCHPYNMMKMRQAAVNRMLGFLIFLCCLVAVDGFFQQGGRALPVASHDSGSEHWKALTQENFTLVHDHEFTLCIIMLSCKIILHMHLFSISSNSNLPIACGSPSVCCNMWLQPEFRNKVLNLFSRLARSCVHSIRIRGCNSASDSYSRSREVRSWERFIVEGIISVSSPCCLCLCEGFWKILR